MPTNLAIDPSFETRTDVWSPRGNCSVALPTVTNAFDGNKVLRMTALALGDMDIHNSGVRTPIGANISYVYSVRVRPRTNVTRDVHLFVDHWNGESYLGGVTGPTVSVGPGGWTSVGMVQTTPASNTHVQSAVRIHNAAAGEEWEVDAVAVYANTTDVSYQGPYAANAGIDQTVAANSVVTLTGIPAGGTWTQDSGAAVTFSAPVTTANDTKVTFLASNASTSTNEVRVFRYTHYPIVDARDFENNSLAGWGWANWSGVEGTLSTTTTAPRSGTYALQATVTSGSGDGIVNSPFTEVGSVTPGDSINGTVWVKGSVEFSVLATLVWKMADNNEVGGSPTLRKTVPANTWTEFSITGTAPANTSKTQISLHYGPVSGTPLFFVDDLLIRKMN